MGKTMQVIKWLLALGLSSATGIMGAVVGFYIGIYLRSLLAGLFLAWVGFTVAAYLAFLLGGIILRIQTARVLLQRTPP